MSKYLRKCIQLLPGHIIPKAQGRTWQQDKEMYDCKPEFGREIMYLTKTRGVTLLVLATAEASSEKIVISKAC